ncbi:hypothetical protein ACH5RR_022678 [Cinchona calisaya]|uniref:SRR1-like domain-containing protein n=1 Tax=Cinchona calisaya TaxID=153742 RepID=A0ABD2Z8H1_9GENT
MPFRSGNYSSSKSKEEVEYHDDDIQTSYDEHAPEDEAERIFKEIKIAIEHVKESKFQCQLKKVMGESYCQVNMVIYALGSLEFGFNPIFQLAIALLIKQDFSSWIGGKIEVYDPIFSPADVIVLKELGCEVLLINEECRREAEKPTLFYMPYAAYILVDNLLWANWCPSRINQLILLTRSFKISHNLSGKNPKTQFSDVSKNYIDAIQDQFSDVSENYIDAIQDHTKEILIKEIPFF